MIGFIALGIVMLIWVLTWEGEESAQRSSSDPAGARDVRPAV
jgi:hypothetical protein